MSEVTRQRVSPMLFGTCKRGHPRTKETTFERKTLCKKCNPPKLYIVRECRICHAMRNTDAPSWSKGRSKSKWAPLRGEGRP